MSQYLKSILGGNNYHDIDIDRDDYIRDIDFRTK